MRHCVSVKTYIDDFDMYSRHLERRCKSIELILRLPYNVVLEVQGFLWDRTRRNLSMKEERLRAFVFTRGVKLRSIPLLRLLDALRHRYHVCEWVRVPSQQEHQHFGICRVLVGAQCPRRWNSIPRDANGYAKAAKHRLNDLRRAERFFSMVVRRLQACARHEAVEYFHDDIILDYVETLRYFAEALGKAIVVFNEEPAEEAFDLRSRSVRVVGHGEVCAIVTYTLDESGYVQLMFLDTSRV